MSQLRIVDFTGQEIKFTKTTSFRLRQLPKRIVCLSAAGLDILIELGLEPVGYLSKGIAGNQEFYGDRAKNFSDVGSWMFPNFQKIKSMQPNLIIGWIFPHRFYQKKLARIASTYLMGGNGYQSSFKRLRDIAKLTGNVTRAEKAIACLQQRFTRYYSLVPQHKYKTVLFMGGSNLNYLSRRFIVETNAGTMGSIIEQFTNYSWFEPKYNREPGLTNASLEEILARDPDVIFMQTYLPAKTALSEQLKSDYLWQQLKAVQSNNVYEIEQLWHYGNGTHMISLTLDKLMPLIYPELYSPLKLKAV